MSAYNISMAPARKRLRDMNVDEFLNADSNSESDNSSSQCDISDTVGRKNKPQSNLKAKSRNDSSVPTNGRSLPDTKVKGKKKVKVVNKQLLDSKMKYDNKNSLASTLKESDPEFYDFLKGQDKSLLENLEDLSDSSDEGSEDDSGAEQPESSGKGKSTKDSFEKELLQMSSGDESDGEDDPSVHKLPDKLEVASDESTDEEDNDTIKNVSKKGGILLTYKMIDKWTAGLRKQPSRAVFKEIVSAFHGAVQETEGEEDQPQVSKYRVEGGEMFNSVVRLCLTQVVPALQALLQLPSLTDVRQVMTDKSAAWKKIKLQVKSYLSDLLKLLARLSEVAMINAFLKHVHKLVVFYASFPKLTKLFLKKVIQMWSTGEETTRVLAFLCINKVVRLKQDELLETCLKQMYVAYVSNCKFTSPTTLPLINFMQRSLVEVFAIDQTVAYQYAFVYLRQLAIHLRNAISVKKKETCQTVYNWQYIHCLNLWVQLLCSTYPSDVLQPLIYPLTQTIIGTVKLLPTARYYPLRFNCVRILNQLSSKTNTFIPTVPFLLEVFEQTDFNRRHKNISLKPFNFAVILKFSKAQLGEKAFKDGLIDQLYEYLLESFNIQAHSIGFPELIIPSVLQLKEFLKKCKIANYCKQIKQIVDKIQEHSKYIVEKRNQCNINLTDFQAVSLWESNLSSTETPLRKYYTSWRKLRDRELQHQISNKEAISGAAFDIPTIDRKRPNKATPEEREDFSKLFEDVSDSEDETRFMLKEDRPDKERKKNADSEDDYSDFDDDELDQLAQSGSDGDESSDGGESSDGDESENASDDAVEVLQKKSAQNKRPLPTPVKLKRTHEAAFKSNGVDEDDVLEDFALSDFENSD